MLFTNRRPKQYSYYRYFSRLNFFVKLAILGITLAIIVSIMEYIDKNKSTIVPFIIIIAVFVVAYKPVFGALKRYLDYKQFGSVNISKPQLNALLSALSPRQFEVFCAEI